MISFVSHSTRAARVSSFSSSPSFRRTVTVVGGQPASWITAIRRAWSGSADRYVTFRRQFCRNPSAPPGKFRTCVMNTQVRPYFRVSAKARSSRRPTSRLLLHSSTLISIGGYGAGRRSACSRTRVMIPPITIRITSSVASPASTISRAPGVCRNRPRNPLSQHRRANPAIVQLLLQFAQIEIMKKEDSLVFGTTGNGIRANSTNDVTLGSAAGGYASLDFDDLIDLESELTAEYLAGEDIQGSGIIGGVPRYWLPHALVQELKKKKETGTGAYMDEAKELRNEKKIFGYEAKRVLSLPSGSGLAAADKVAVFGNLSHVWCGNEPGFRIAIADQGATDNGGSEVNLFDTAQVAIRVLEFFDSVVVDEEAFSKAKLAA